MEYNFFYICWIIFDDILLRILASIVMKDIGLSNFFVLPLSGFGIRIILAQEEQSKPTCHCEDSKN